MSYNFFDVLIAGKAVAAWNDQSVDWVPTLNLGHMSDALVHAEEQTKNVDGLTIEGENHSINGDETNLEILVSGTAFFDNIKT